MFYPSPIKATVEGRFMGYAPHDVGSWHAYPVQGNYSIHTDARMCQRHHNYTNQNYNNQNYTNQNYNNQNFNYQVGRQYMPNLSTVIKLDREGFEVSIDMQHYALEEISVKVVNGFLVIEGKHPEKRDEHGYVTRHMIRRYPVPDSCNTDAVSSRLCPDGLLIVFAPKRVELIRGERVVPVLPLPGPENQMNQRGPMDPTN